VAAAVILAVEGIFIGGLNAYADSKTTSVTALVQDYYADVAAAVALGDAISAEHVPSSVTFATVQSQVQTVYTELGQLDAPGGLVTYVSAVKAWASEVLDAATNSEIGIPWQGMPYTPAPFQLTMTVDQADAAFSMSMQEIPVLLEFGSRAVAIKDVATMRYIGARLDAQAYWLEGVATSADPNWIAAHFHFLEPFNSGTNAATADAGTDVRLVAAPAWPRTRYGPICVHTVRSSSYCLGQAQQPLAALWEAAFFSSGACAQINGHCTSYGDPAQRWTTAVNDWITASGQALGGAGAGLDTSGAPPKTFVDECKAGGGTIGATSSKARLPTTESGWTCPTHGSTCWNFLTYSGTEYKGGQSGCPEQGLVPSQLGPLGGVIDGIGGFFGGLNASNNSPLPSSTPSNLPPGFPTIPAGRYSIQVCATGVPCVDEPGTESDAGQIATALEDLENSGPGLCGAAQGADSCSVSYTPCSQGCSVVGTYFDVTVSFTTGCDLGQCQSGQVVLRVTRVG
jgi:hypothetical protein